ncbi:hypothetical protein A2574_00430 [Candidatus Shapirobacteria bacterium RIFOXYD1_FULL_38_32]|uniref:Oligopeptide ABC transporter, substrate-binding lipoprotein n=1 Tax=Candidatus Shapirobacteria bacterium GW2011_GWE1_38_92 TaxID=1618489 RepID=A0A0G0LG16_9BACT|nr:MAG: Oligopeptide ABC transporter, substrate-binding lipoprotein [Candidatus Shapirobacteria bacterium GW2011_GWE1_38_92]OGL55367.1 MAG: hypothetical protein A2195_00180 [Candidatus Shapirobacteria bacterium RIFOXYA1_FULL_39_17]OGL56969.1 MAG: hypothetical protein A2410_01085 [Candidatus Shapirobacteria bacterium RIFOXYC1_FULL_38_24]OGL57623.1 MAG: hypothetical protein A2574_00430 [Candidatus Shapirobacteria bacterium RIFOXYD1_FULL_38_32]HCU55351.1 hypothetical protein [Candidatus Shapirobac
MFKKIHFKFEFLYLQIKRNYPILFLIVFLGSLAYIFQTQIRNIILSNQNNREIIGVEGRFTADTLPKEISLLISYGLTINTDNDRPAPSPLVKEWKLDNNNRDYIFTLNDNIFWHNNKKFTSKDINYQINGVEITYLNDQQIKFTLKDNFAPLLANLDKTLIEDDFNGLGDYRVTQTIYQEGHIKKIKLLPLNKSMPAKTFVFYSGEKDLINAYKLGEINQIYEISNTDPIQNWPKTEINPKILTNQRYIAIFFNTAKIDNKQLRQALSYATPKPKDKKDRCLGPISPLSWAYNPYIKEYNYNATRAKELFKDNEITEISLSVIDRRLLPQAEEIKSSWQEILGIKVNLSIENQIDPNNFQAVLAFGAIPSDPDQYLFWHSTQTKTNLTKLNNPKIDKLLEEGRRTLDFQERKIVYQDFQRSLLEEVPAIFLSHPTVYTVIRTNKNDSK